MYRYILFDLDGTLTDSKEGIVNSVRWTLRSMDAPVPEEEILQLFIGPPLQDSFPRSGLWRPWPCSGSAICR